jgi:hypothetical protein
MLKLPGILNLNEWNQQVMQLGLGDISTPGIEERRLKKQSSEYNLYVYNGTENVWCNNPYYEIKNPRVFTYYYKLIGINGTTITFPEAFLSIPIPTGTPYNGPHYIKINNITTTSMKVYLYDSTGAPVASYAHLVVIGDRNV